MNARLIFNTLAICGAAAFAGVMLNIGLTLGAYWKSLAPAAFLDWFAQNSILVGRTIPVVAIPTVIGLVGSIWIGWSLPQERMLWALAIACIVVLGAITAGYHLPTNAAFVAKSIALENVPAKLDQWLTLHWVRIALGFGAAVLGVVAMSQK